MNRFSTASSIFFVFTVVVAACSGGPPAFAQQNVNPPAAAAQAKSLSTLQFEFQVYFEQANKPLRVLGERYTAQLRRLEAGLIASGNTEAAGIVRKEIELHEVKKVEMPQALAEARRIQGIYDRERLPLARERNRRARPLIEGFQQKLNALKVTLSNQGDQAEVEKIESELKELGRMKKRLTAAAAPGRRPPEPVPVFEDGFEKSRIRSMWTVRNGSPAVSDGWLRTADNETEIETPLGFWPGEGFRIEFEVAKHGEKHHSGWDFEIVVGGIKGSLLFDAESEDWLAVAGEEISVQESYAADSSNQGRAALTWLNGKAQFQFTNSQGRSLRSDWIPVAISGDTMVRIRLAGGGEDSPRLIDNVRIYRGSEIGREKS